MGPEFRYRSDVDSDVRPKTLPIETRSVDTLRSTLETLSLTTSLTTTTLAFLQTSFVRDYDPVVQEETSPLFRCLVKQVLRSIRSGVDGMRVHYTN